MINAELLKILCCPETRQSLEEANQELVGKLNALIQEKNLKKLN